MKYFIENKEGEWLKNPDEVMGPGQPNCWTRDPDKAWGFDKTDNSSWGEWMFKDTGQWVLYNLRKEDCLAPDTKITEHEFISTKTQGGVYNIYTDKGFVWIDEGGRNFYKVKIADR